jgi:hypothetical protein
MRRRGVSLDRVSIVDDAECLRLQDMAGARILASMAPVGSTGDCSPPKARA